MAVYYKFKSAKDYNSIPIDGHFISVGNLKEKIFESKQLGRGTDFDLVVTNAQTSEEYLDESMLIPKNTSVLIRRVPGRPRMPIVTAPVPEPDENMVENGYDDVQSVRNGSVGIESSAVKYPDDLEWDEFGNDLYAIPEMAPPQSSNTVQDAPPPSKVDEDSKIKALIETPSLDWQRQSADVYGTGRGYGRGMGGRMMGGRGFGRGGLERKTPPQGYVCHRCKVPGHFIQHCPTNGDPNFDIRRVKPPTGIPKSMLMATPDGSYVLPGGAAAVLKPNEAAFEKEIEGMPSNRPVGDLPPELHCPLCKEVIKDAVLTSKCCFNSFCDRCIRDYIISRSMCVCGATNILADDLLPNKTLRDTISRILESNNSSGNDGGSNFQAQDMESRNPQAKPPSPAQSVASKSEQGVEAAVQNIDPAEGQEGTQRVSAQHQTSEQGRPSRVVDASEATAESLSVKEPTLQGNALLPGEEVQQKPSSGEAAKKKKKKKARLPMNGTEVPWRNPQDLAAESYMMSMPPAAYNPYWNGMHPGMEGFGGPYAGNVPYMGYGLGPGPLDMPFGAVLPHDPFAGPGCMFPPFAPPQRDLAAEFGMGYNPGPPLMSREEFEAKKADLKRKREFERRGEREMPKDREYAREVNSMGDVSSVKSRPTHGPSSSENVHQRQRPERPSPDLRSRDPELPRPSSKRKSEQDQPHYHHHHDHHDRDDRDNHKRHTRDDYYPEDHHPRHREYVREYVDDKKPSHDRERDYVDDKKSSHDREYVDDKKPSHHRSSSHQHHSKATPEPPATAPKSSSTSDKKHKGSVFSRISFPAEGQPAAPKKRKVSSSGEALAPAPSVSGSNSHRAPSNGYYDDHKVASISRKSSAPVDVDYDQSSEDDDDRHFKRKPSRYESSPPAPVEWEEDGPPAPRHSSRGTRDREREKERGGGGYSKHR